MTVAIETRRVLMAVAAVLLALAMSIPHAHAADLAPLVQEFASKKFDKKIKAIEALAATADPKAVTILEALGARKLFVRKTDKRVVAAEKSGKSYELSDPVTGEALGTVKKRAVKKVRLNNKMRRAIKAALGSMTLMSPDRTARITAAEAVFKSRDANALPALDAAIAAETDSTVKTLFTEARAAIILTSDAAEADKLAAVATMRARADRDSLDVLKSVSGDDAVATAANDAIEEIEQILALWSAGQNVFYGLSLGSVLLLAAIGLAITFGVMGVINMAHGEMIMIGAYVTFTIQEIIRTSAPNLFDYSLFMALPAAFLVAGLVGMAIERGVIRFLYGRPLETLLATWGISLVLQQAVRSIFGPTNARSAIPVG